MPKYFTTSADTPTSKVLRIQHKDTGIGPYLSDNDEVQNIMRGSNLPSPQTSMGWDESDIESLEDPSVPKKFGFLNEEQMINSIGQDRLDKLKEHGFEPTWVDADHVWHGDNKQVFFSSPKQTQKRQKQLDTLKENTGFKEFSPEEIKAMNEKRKLGKSAREEILEEIKKSKAARKVNQRFKQRAIGQRKIAEKQRADEAKNADLIAEVKAGKKAANFGDIDLSNHKFDSDDHLNEYLKDWQTNYIDSFNSDHVKYDTDAGWQYAYSDHPMDKDLEAIRQNKHLDDETKKQIEWFMEDTMSDTLSEFDESANDDEDLWRRGALGEGSDPHGFASEKIKELKEMKANGEEHVPMEDSSVNIDDAIKEMQDVIDSYQTKPTAAMQVKKSARQEIEELLKGMNNAGIGGKGSIKAGMSLPSINNLVPKVGNNSATPSVSLPQPSKKSPIKQAEQTQNPDIKEMKMQEAQAALVAPQIGKSEDKPKFGKDTVVMIPHDDDNMMVYHGDKAHLLSDEDAHAYFSSHYDVAPNMTNHARSTGMAWYSKTGEYGDPTEEEQKHALDLARNKKNTTGPKYEDMLANGKNKVSRPLTEDKMRNILRSTEQKEKLYNMKKPKGTLMQSEKEEVIKAYENGQWKIEKSNYKGYTPADNVRRKKNNIDDTGIKAMPRVKKYGKQGANQIDREVAESKAKTVKGLVTDTRIHPETGEEVTVSMTPKKLKNYIRKMNALAEKVKAEKAAAAATADSGEQAKKSEDERNIPDNRVQGKAHGKGKFLVDRHYNSGMGRGGKGSPAGPVRHIDPNTGETIKVVNPFKKSAREEILEILEKSGASDKWSKTGARAANQGAAAADKKYVDRSISQKEIERKTEAENAKNADLIADVKAGRNRPPQPVRSVYSDEEVAQIDENMKDRNRPEKHGSVRDFLDGLEQEGYDKYGKYTPGGGYFDIMDHDDWWNEDGQYDDDHVAIYHSFDDSHDPRHASYSPRDDYDADKYDSWEQYMWDQMDKKHKWMTDNGYEVVDENDTGDEFNQGVTIYRKKKDQREAGKAKARAEQQEIDSMRNENARVDTETTKLSRDQIDEILRNAGVKKTADELFEKLFKAREELAYLKKSAREQILEDLEKKGRCWEGYKPVKGKKAYEKGSCEPVSKQDLEVAPEGSKNRESYKDEFEKKEEKKKKKDEKPFHGYNKDKHSTEGGMSEKAREEHNRKTGSNLKKPVTAGEAKDSEEKAGRRKSFCARMSGVQGPTSKGGKLTRKGAALKRWDC
jgi:hypothetical protein